MHSSRMASHFQRLTVVIQPFAQLSARTETDHLSPGNGQGLTRLGVAPPARGFVSDIQAAELHQFD